MKTAVALILVAAGLGQAPVSNPGFRIGFVQKVYIESLGSDDAARIVHDLLTAALMNKAHLQVESTKSSADAVLTGNAIVSSGTLHWAVGSATATQNSATAQVSTGAKTVRVTQLGLQLSDVDGRIIWAFDGSHCLDVTTLVLWGIPRKKAPTVCAVDQLVKAIEKDASKAGLRR